MSRYIGASSSSDLSEEMDWEPEKTFSFFKLPRGLRESIYLRCVERGDVFQVFRELRNVRAAGVGVAAAPRLRLICKQFSEEYDEEIQRDPESRSAWIEMSSTENYDEESGHNPRYGPPRDLNGLSWLLRRATTLRAGYFSHNLENPGTISDFQTMMSLMPALKHVQDGSVSVWIRGLDIERFDDRKWELHMAKVMVLCDLNNLQHNVLLGDFSVEAIAHAEFPTFEVNRRYVATFYRGLLRPGSITVDLIIQMFKIHPVRYQRFRLKKSSAAHTLHGFEVENGAVQQFRQLSFADIEHDVISKLLLHHDAPNAPLSYAILDNWSRELDSYYRV